MSATISIQPNRRTRHHRHDRHHQPIRHPHLDRQFDPLTDRQAPQRSAACRAQPVPAATYRRRRAIVGTVLAVLVAVSAVLAHDVLAGSGGDPASAAASQPARTRVTVTARPGDTLWSIAEAHHGDIALARYVDALVDLNGGASIQAGQGVLLP